MNHYFDADGVLLDTPKRKTTSFYYAALEYGEAAAREMVRIHRTAGSVGRKARWERFFAEVLCRDPEPGELDERLQTTTDYILDGVRLAQPLPGVIEYLERLTDPIVVSGIEQDELQNILESKGLLRYFARVYGGDKSQIIPRLIHEGEITLPATYYGDELNDLIVARASNMDFVFIEGASEWQGGREYCEQRGYRVFRDFTSMI